MSHLTPGQFVDLAEGAQSEASAPHLRSCDACRRQLADMREMMADSAGAVPDPSPLFWEHLSARVSAAVAAESRPRTWRERLLRPAVFVPAVAGALAVALLVVALPVPPAATTSAMIPATPLPIASGSTLPSLPPLAPLGAADDPQLGLVADYGTTLEWDEMREEIALAAPGSIDAAVVDALTIGEQRELQRLLVEEMAQPRALENRS